MMQHVKTFLVVASAIASVGCATGRKMAYEPDFVDLVRSGRVQKAELHRTDGQAAIAVAHLNEPTGAHGTIRVQVPAGAIDVKTGVGGIRDIEFLVQGLQLVHLAQHPELFCGNTLEALAHLREAGVIEPDVADELTEHYAFLRRVEHFLQLLEDRQTHTVPGDPKARQALARRVTGDNQEAARFSDKLEHVRAATREYYLKLLGIR